MRVKSLLVMLLGMLFMLAATTGCAQDGKENGQENSPAKLKIGSLTTEENLPVLVAQENGYFDAEDVQVEFVPLLSPVELQNTFQSGALDGMITDMMIALMLKSSGEELRITSIALGSAPQEGRFAIVAAPKSDIKSVQDLKGKSIGISNNSIIEYVTDGILEQAGMSPSDVNKTTVAKIPVRIEMLLNNQIDAIVVPDPHISYAVANGARVVADDTSGENLSQSVIIMTQTALNSKNDAISRFYNAYARAVEEINNNPEQYKELLVTSINVPKQIADSYKVQHYPLPQLPVEEDVNNVITWLKNKGLLKADINYQDVIWGQT
ncbi:putative aliphatic sulfonates-binding protein precursor [Sporotomaculum syntrophicum]|uniref:Aliphatic sulfonates-binding protein n=1 Tax=Sporotomaculum syntrophicum TaxID=182264 RepID=A0A9D2WRY7_9FIRM|nr:MetQ/NlpA family ABC transporter substrate-binding protein [Sporotomaculum syntrophicum]KAF1085507.1 putative aliphatic sulfonates-binding protein precursor [Sporotomaculum syntrophicum]